MDEKIQILREIEQIKKIEFHRHIEGSITPEFLQKLSNKYQPDHKLAESSKIEKLYSFTTFNGFLDSFTVGVKLLRDLEDLENLCTLVVEQLKNENIIYAELIYSPQNMIKNKFSLEEILETLSKSLNNIQVSLIIDIVRNFGIHEANSFISLLTPNIIDEYNHLLKAISIGGDELNYPANLFTDVFRTVKELGLKTYAHAGELGSSNNVWDAIDLLGVQRIGHGIRSVDDLKLVKYLKKRKICLDISVKSNFLTGAVSKDSIHPLKKIIEMNVPFSINTDDPGYFKTTLNDEYFRLLDLGLEINRIKELPLNIIAFSYLDQEEQMKLRKRL